MGKKQVFLFFGPKSQRVKFAGFMPDVLHESKPQHPNNLGRSESNFARLRMRNAINTLRHHGFSIHQSLPCITSQHHSSPWWHHAPPIISMKHASTFINMHHNASKSSTNSHHSQPFTITHHHAPPRITLYHHSSPSTTMQQNAPSSGTAIASMMKQAWTGLPLSAVILGSPTSSMHWSFATAWVKKVIFVVRHNLNEDCGLALSSDAFSIAFKNMPASFLSPKLRKKATTC